VGRGGYKGYCILKSADKENERLKLVCSTTNGFTLAEEDAKLRGPGDILGERQSGNNKDIELVLKYPEMYKYAQKEAKAHVAPLLGMASTF
jgi:ATP-dependent DNA helicase RecG